MKYIRRLRLFENSQELNQEQIDFLNYCTFPRVWGVNKNTGLVDVEGDFTSTNKGIESFKGIRFGRIGGNFFIGGNRLTSLEGSPQEVIEGFYCHNNKLFSLEGAPRKVGMDFKCRGNRITSLEGSPNEIHGSFDCSSNYLRSLEGAPQKVGELFSCNSNHITSLEGSPQEVGDSFYCVNNNLTSLEGSPKEVGGLFSCNENDIISLKGAPNKIGGGFSCDLFNLPENSWNLNGWWEIFDAGDSEVKKLIATLPKFAEDLNKEIENNPGKWVMNIKGVWNLEEFRPLRDQLKVSDQFLKDIGDQSALSDLGF